MTRFALIFAPADTVAAYLPANYTVVGEYVSYRGSRDTIQEPLVQTVIAGKDDAGWTLDGYVFPRLASGRYFGHELTIKGTDNV